MNDIGQWFIPLISLVVVIEWGIIVWIRRHESIDGVPRGRLSLVDMLILAAGLGLLVSSLQYPVITTGQDARIALGIVRFLLLFSGANILWDEYQRLRDRTHDGS